MKFVGLHTILKNDVEHKAAVYLAFKFVWKIMKISLDQIWQNFVNLNYKMLKVLIVLKPFPLYNYFHSQKLDLFKHKTISTLKNWIYLKLLIAIFLKFLARFRPPFSTAG